MRSPSGWGSIAAFADGTRRRFFSARQPGIGKQRQTLTERRMSPEQRNRLIDILASGEELSPEWSRILFPPEKREYELVYHGKEREEDIIANTLAVPLQPVRTFKAGGGIFGEIDIVQPVLQQGAQTRIVDLQERQQRLQAIGR